MERKRIRLIVEVDLDPVPGIMSTPVSAQSVIHSILSERISHYNPTISLTAETDYIQSEIQNEV